ncbi:MAG: N-methyl-l-tryptophan oxidase [Chloroflexi bacterium]|nr:MAG: N-methyl-l-tryptophan oxidase [Chloroflexota bacterium]
MRSRVNYHVFDYIVIGNGLMGAAAARYLSQITSKVALIGPSEPEDIAGHTSVFASHYDQGRITKQISKDAVWSLLAMRAEAQYEFLQNRSGIHFHEPVGCLLVAPPADSCFSKLLATAQQFNVDYVLYGSPAEQQLAHPQLHFPDTFASFFEPDPAGYLNPRELRRAQERVALAQGARVIREMVTAVCESEPYVTVLTESGQTYRTRKVLVAAGAFTNTYDLLPKKLPLSVKTETTLLARVSEPEAKRLAKLPAIVYMVDNPVLDSIYMLPPIHYPDGNIYVKLGCNTKYDQWPTNLQQMRNWMIAGDSDVAAPEMQAAMLAVLPDLAVESFETKRCLVTYTTHGKPFVDQVGERIYVAVGGNGSSAKSSDTIGWLAANLMQMGTFPNGFKREDFRAA